MRLHHKLRKWLEIVLYLKNVIFLIENKLKPALIVKKKKVKTKGQRSYQEGFFEMPFADCLICQNLSWIFNRRGTFFAVLQIFLKKP